MDYLSTISAKEMRLINRSAIIQLLRRESPISRTEISNKLNISLPTVIRIVDELIEDQFVNETPNAEWSGGRRRSLIEFNEAGNLVLGVDMGNETMTGAIADFGGNLLNEGRQTRRSRNAEENFNYLVELIQSLINTTDIKDRRLLGIGVGTPGVTNQKTGTVHLAPSLNWNEFPLQSRLREHFHHPIIIDNDANLGALGEYWFGAGQGAKNMVMLTVGTGIGAGIIQDGTVYRGSNNASGEIGYLMAGREFLGKNYRKGFGALESIASATGIINQASQELRGSPMTHNEINLETVFKSALEGRKWAKTVLEKAVDYLSIAVSSICVLFDPDVIVLGGTIFYSSDSLIEQIKQNIEGSVLNMPQLVLSKLQRNAVVMGAVTTVLQKTYESYIVKKLP